MIKVECDNGVICLIPADVYSEWCQAQRVNDGGTIKSRLEEFFYYERKEGRRNNVNPKVETNYSIKTTRRGG